MKNFTKSFLYYQQGSKSLTGNNNSPMNELLVTMRLLATDFSKSSFPIFVLCYLFFNFIPVVFNCTGCFQLHFNCFPTVQGIFIFIPVVLTVQGETDFALSLFINYAHIFSMFRLSTRLSSIRKHISSVLPIEIAFHI